jgi:hypothetical protein
MVSWITDTHKYITAAIDSQMTEASPQAEQPAAITTALRPHQLSLLAAARDLESKASIRHVDLQTPQLLTRYGVLADRVGSGKSLVALSLVQDPPVEHAQLTLKEGGCARILGLKHMPPVQDFNEAWSDLSGTEMAKAMIPTNSAKFYSRTSLFIVPHNVIQQWESYINDQTQLRAYIVKRTKDSDHERAGFYKDVFTSELVVVSCTMLRKFMAAIQAQGIAFSSIVWSRLFVDEADTLSFTLRPHDVAARFMWFITGSWLNMLFPTGLYVHTIQGLPPAVRTLIGDGGIAGVSSRLNVVAWSLADTREGRFASLILRNTDAWIDASLLRPAIIHDTVLCKAPANLGILRDYISAAAMEALHAGDTEGALTALGLKASSKETLAERVTQSLRSDLIQAEKILAFKRDIEYSSAAGKIAAIEKAEAKVTRLKSQLLSLESRLASL